MFSFCQARIKALEEQLHFYQSLEPTEINIQQEKEFHFVLNEWNETLEIIWRPKSRELWLRADDHNSKFFHSVTIAKRRRIFILALKDDNGLWLDSRRSIWDFLIGKF